MSELADPATRRWLAERYEQIAADSREYAARATDEIARERDLAVAKVFEEMAISIRKVIDDDGRVYTFVTQ